MSLRCLPVYASYWALQQSLTNAKVAHLQGLPCGLIRPSTRAMLERYTLQVRDMCRACKEVEVLALLADVVSTMTLWLLLAVVSASPMPW